MTQNKSQKPMAWAHYDTFKNLDSLTRVRFNATLATKNTGACCIALYTHPPQRTWVGLTDEDVMEIWEKIKDGDWAIDFYDVIEAKLKEKNT